MFNFNQKACLKSWEGHVFNYVYLFINFMEIFRWNGHGRRILDSVSGWDSCLSLLATLVVPFDCHIIKVLKQYLFCGWYLCFLLRGIIKGACVFNTPRWCLWICQCDMHRLIAGRRQRMWVTHWAINENFYLPKAPIY